MKLVILDRDGVINQDSDNYVKSAAEWIPLPGSIEAMARLSRAGYQVAIATNQSGLGRGLFPATALTEMHNKMKTLVTKAGGRIDALVWCPHTPDDQCDCRKPAPGLIYQIEQHLGLSAKNAWIVGDSLRDLEAGIAAGCKPVLVKTGKGLRMLEKNSESLNAPVFDDLAQFVDQLLQTEISE
ncbi:D-glycero-beta-D-manno-heptose 1,7-bisphosphate 7-phosphatase [Spongorhabdus nitratireducens]